MLIKKIPLYYFLKVILSLTLDYLLHLIYLSVFSMIFSSILLPDLRIIVSHSCLNKLLSIGEKSILRYQTCHTRESGYPENILAEIPAYAGMTQD